MRISDWSSDVCSSDLAERLVGAVTRQVCDIFLTAEFAPDLRSQPCFKIDCAIIQSDLGVGRVGIDFEGVERQRRELRSGRLRTRGGFTDPTAAGWEDRKRV